MIQLTQAHFSFGGKPILDGVSLLIPEGARVGLLGRNGAGKTTLFRLILGELALESGSIVVPREWRVSFLPQNPSSPDEETILRHVMDSHPALRDLEDEMLRTERRMGEESDPLRLDRLVERHRALGREFEAQGGYDYEAKVTATLVGLGFSRDDLLRLIGPLSPGEKNRLALAKVLLAEADILLLDEPTNHLDFEMLEWLEGFLRGPASPSGHRKTTVVVASHDRYFLNQFTQDIVELREGQLFMYRGNYDRFARQRAEEIEREEKQHQLQQEEIARDLEFIRRNFAAQKARQAKSREKKLERMDVFESPRRELEGPRIRFTGVAKAGDDVLSLCDLDCGYGGEPLVCDVRLDLKRGDRVAILGPNGCGKTTLLRCIVGELVPLRGIVRRGVRTVIGYYEQELARLGGTKALFDEIHDLVPQWTDQAVRGLLAAFLFRGDEILKKSDSLSGGEMARLALIRLILSGANLLVLDEPTNHLDIYARAALEESLLEFPETIIFVSHDRYFVERLATRILAIHDGALREFIGDYEDYRTFCRHEAKARETEEEAAREQRRLEALARAPRAAPASSWAQEKKLVAAISKLEEEIRGKHYECAQEANYRSPENMRRLKREIAELGERLEELYRKWEALSG